MASKVTTRNPQYQWAYKQFFSELTTIKTADAPFNSVSKTLLEHCYVAVTPVSSTLWNLSIA